MSTCSAELQEIPQGIGLPADYSAKRCRFFRCWSCALCPWNLDGTELKKWHPVLPWSRGTKEKPISDRCKVCAIVWEQGGFEGRYHCLTVFAKTIEDDPTVLHKFLDIRSNIVNMKIQDPRMKFRIEKNLGCLESVSTHEKTEQGLKANKAYFVELAEYIKDHPDPEPHEIVWDTLPNGQRVQGVNVSMGKKGWWKRVDQRLSGVKRHAQLTEENVDPSGEALDRIHTSAKKAMLRDIRATAIAMAPDIPHSGASSSASAFHKPATACGSKSDAPDAGRDGGGGDESSDDENASAPAGIMGFLKTRFGGGPSEAASKPKASAKSTARATTTKVNPKQPVAKAATTKVSKKAASTPAVKEVVGNAGGGGAKKRKSPNVSCYDIDDDDVTVDVAGLSPSDRAVLDGFFGKLKPLKNVSPPIADKEFKSTLSEQSTSVTQLMAEVRVKRKSAGRRQCGEESVPPLVAELVDMEKELKQIHNVYRCLLGQVAVPSDKTLLQTLDDASAAHGMVFGGAVIRRALKVLLHEDVKTCSFEKMMSDSYKITMARFIADEQNKSESGEDFFAISVSQVFLKMIKAVLIQKKDQLLQQQTEKLEKFLDAVHQSSVSKLADDAGVLIPLLRASTAPVTKVKHSVDTVNSKQTLATLPLCAVAMGTSFGTKLLAEARIHLEARGTNEALTSEVTTAFEKIPNTWYDFKKEPNVNHDEWCTRIFEARDALNKATGNKQFAKKMGKEAAMEFNKHLESAVILVAWDSFQNEVKPWMSEAIDGMKAKRCFLEPPVNSWHSYKLAKLPQYDPFKAYFDTVTDLSKETIGYSTQLKQADGQEIHNLLEKFAESSLNLEEVFKKEKLVTENDIKANFGDGVKGLCHEIRVLRDSMTEKSSLDVKRALLNTMQLIVAAVSEKDGVLPSLTENDPNIEKLQLLAATLPDEGPSGRRAVQLMAADFIGTFHGLACAVHEASSVTADKLGSSLIMKLTKFIQQGESAWKDCSTDRVKMATDILRALRTPEESNLTAEALVDGQQNLVKSATQVISTWKDLKATQFLTLTKGIDDLNIVDVRSLSYTNKDPKDMPTIAKDFESLSDHAGRLQDLSHKSGQLQDVINEVKGINMEKEVGNYDKAMAVQNNLMSVIALIVMVMILGGKRFAKAVTKDTKLPEQPLADLKDTLATCQEFNLHIPGELQALAVSFVSGESTDKDDDMTKKNKTDK